MFLIHLPDTSPFWRVQSIIKAPFTNALAVHQIPTTPNTFSFQKLYLCRTLTPIKSTLLSAICQWAFSKAIKYGHWQTCQNTMYVSLSIYKNYSPWYNQGRNPIWFLSPFCVSLLSELAFHLFPSVSFDKENFICLFASFNTRVKMLSGHNECKPCDAVSRENVFLEKCIQSRRKRAEPKAWVYNRTGDRKKAW